MPMPIFDMVTTPYLEPLGAFWHEYGMMVLGALVLLTSFTGRRFGPLAFLPMLFGLGLVLSGAARLLIPFLGRS